MKMLTKNVIAAIVSTVVLTVPGYIARKTFRKDEPSAQEVANKGIEDLHLDFGLIDKDVFKELKSRQREA